QDCVTQRGVIEAYVARMRRRTPQNEQIFALEKIISEYEQRQSSLFKQFHETWRGMAMDEFRGSLNAMASRSQKTKRTQENREQREPVLHMISAAESFSID